ncbi:hypothetical protein CK203_114021 [Vitis vinifera]|uniref:Transmembrane protein n=1 Tax=Vitis vinifera TaxID=29760 RepID=A0A438FF43_VITVI|nr:hypothetical protein CK203_114021 [Vitis vinifera]
MVSTFRSSFLLLLLVSLFALLAFASESDHKILLKLIGICEFFGLRFSVCKCIEALMCCIGIWVLESEDKLPCSYLDYLMLPVVGVISILGLVSMDGLGGPHHGDVP